MRDLSIIKDNVAKMAAQNAPMEHIDDYIASEGYSVDDVRNFKGSAPVANITASDIAAQRPISRGEALLTTSTNIPFAPRIKAFLSAAYAKPQLVAQALEQTGNIQEAHKIAPKFGELYDEALQAERQKLGQAREQYPVQSFASQLPADILIGSAALKGVKTLPAAMGRVAALSAGQSAGETKELLSQQAAAEALGAAALGAGATGVLGLAGKGYNKLFNRNAGEAVKKMTADEVHSLASNSYREAAQKGGYFNENLANKFVDTINDLKPTRIANKILTSENQNLIRDLDEFIDLKGSKLSLEDVDRLDKDIGKKINNYFKDGRLTENGKILVELKDRLRDLVESAPASIVEGSKEGFEALKQARALWGKSQRLREVENLVERAALTDNPATAIKSGFRSLLFNNKKIKYFNKAEREAIKEAAKSGVITDTLRTFGSRLIPIGSIVAGGGLPSAMAGQATSMASRDLATRAQMARAEKVAQQILGNLQKQGKITSIPSSNAAIATRLGSQSIYQPNE